MFFWKKKHFPFFWKKNVLFGNFFSKKLKNNFDVYQRKRFGNCEIKFRKNIPQKFVFFKKRKMFFFSKKQSSCLKKVKKKQFFCQKLSPFSKTDTISFALLKISIGRRNYLSHGIMENLDLGPCVLGNITIFSSVQKGCRSVVSWPLSAFPICLGICTLQQNILGSICKILPKIMNVSTKDDNQNFGCSCITWILD